MRILVLGAGFGGLELTTTLSEALGDEAEITLIDKSDHFVFGFSKLDVMFGKAVPEQVTPPLRRPGEAGRAVRADHDHVDRPRRQAGRDRGRHLRRRPAGGRARRRPPPRRDARPARGRPRVLHGARRVRPARRARRLRRRAGRRGRHLDAVQVPAGTERDGAADARLPHRARAAGLVGDRARHADGACPSRRRPRRRRRC